MVWWPQEENYSLQLQFRRREEAQITTSQSHSHRLYVHMSHSGQDHLKNIPCQAT